MKSVQLHTLIGHIYDAALDPSLWEDFMVAASDAFNGRTSALIFHNLDDPSTSLTRYIRISPENLRRYQEEFFLENDLWYCLVKAQCQPGDIFRGSELITDQDIKKTAMFNEVLKPAEAGYIVGFDLEQTATKAAVFSVHRPIKGPDFTRQDKTYIAALAPHIQRAFFLHERYITVQHTQLSVQEALHQSQTAVILLDDRAKILFINNKAENILQQDDGLSCHGKEIHCSEASDTTTLDALAQRSIITAKKKGIHPGGAMRVHRPSGKKHFQLVVSPLNLRSGHTQLAPEAAACIFLHDPEEEVLLPETILHELYQFTTAETRLVRLLFSGKTLDEICRIQGVKISTLRTQIRSIFEKTHTNTQSDLLRVLSQGPGKINGMLKEENGKNSS